MTESTLPMPGTWVHRVSVSAGVRLIISGGFQVLQAIAAIAIWALVSGRQQAKAA